MSYRIAAMVALSVLLGGCCRTPAGVARTAMPEATVEPQPTYPQCGVCRRVYVMSTQDLYVLIEGAEKMPTLDLSLSTTTGKSIQFQGLQATRIIDASKAIYHVEGGPQGEIASGEITLSDSTEALRVDIETSWTGWPTDGGDYFIGPEKRASFDAEAAGDSRESEPAGARASKAKAMDVSISVKPLGKPRLRLAPPKSTPKRTSPPVKVPSVKTPPPKARPTKVRPTAPRHAEPPRPMSRGRTAAKR